MKKYISLLINYHKNNLYLYLLLFFLIAIFYYFQLPTPLSIILGDFPYWSKGLTRAAAAILRLDFCEAYNQNPLIYLVIIISIFHLFITPIFSKYKNTTP